MGLEWSPVKNVGLVPDYGMTDIDLARNDTSNSQLKMRLVGPSAFVKVRVWTGRGGLVASRMIPSMKALFFRPVAASLSLILAACFGASTALAADPPSRPASSGLHPIAGTWSWTPFNSRCVETFQYRSNNTMLGASGEAVAEWNYTVTPQASEKGFYEVVETSMRQNGKKDCSGDTVDSLGLVNIRFIQFSPARDQMLVCRSPSLEACFGPLKRQR